MFEKDTIELRRSSIKLNLHCISFYDEDSKTYVAYSPALDVSSYSDSDVEARECLREAIGIHLQYAKDNKTLDVLLLDLGWTITKKSVEKYLSPDEQALKKISPSFRDIVNQNKISTSYFPMSLAI